MSHSKEEPEIEKCEFNWGKKRGVGGKKKEVQFYESFTYDGVEYFLYDCVYLYTEGEPEPYIGKLVKIWEQPENKKRIKVLWFFRPVEIFNWLGDDGALENEILLASGEGVGLANVNPLEAIAGKCNVICTSKDNRNPQPSEEELRMTDYIFYRTFDVGTCTISDKIDEKIAGVEVRLLFNRKEDKKSNNFPKLDAIRTEENGNVGVLENGESKETETATVEKEHVSDKKTMPDEGRTVNVSVTKVEDKGTPKLAKDSRLLDDRPSKKAKVDSSIKLSEELKPDIPSSLTLDKDKNGNSVQKKLRVDSEEDGVMPSGRVGGASEDKTKSKPVKDSLGLDKGSMKKVKPDEKATKLENGLLPKAPSENVAEKNLKTDGQILEVTRRPDSARSKWFKGLPWEERMRTADEQGTLVLLENLDPAYTSSQVEDIIWHGFREYCTAKVVPRTAISSPHSGQAFVIFKSRDAAEMAIRQLDERCLMLPNGRPLVASRGTPPSLPGKPSTFVGHLSIDKVKFQMQREEMRRAVSTSHCSQPNTVEYDMAMEWCLLQERSDSWWKELYKQHGDELRKLRAKLKFK